MRLKDKVVLITAVANGIGRATANIMAAEGAIVVGVDNHQERLDTAMNALNAAGGRAHGRLCDALDQSQVDAVVAGVQQEFGRIDVLINNSSPWLGKKMMELTEADWDLVVGVTAKGTFFCSQAAAPIMLQQGRGVIVNVADLSVYEVWPGYGHHAVAKAGVVQLTRYLARDLGPAVRVVAVAPGPVLLPPEFTAAETAEAIERTLVKRLGEPGDGSRMIGFLIEQDYLTGHVYFVDGGQMFSH